MFALVQFFELDLELDGASCNHVLDFKLLQAGLFVAYLLDNSCVVLGRVQALLLALGACDYHIAIFENQCSRSDRLAYLHS